ncbi:MAG: PilN domain-containing protein [Myxococcota bacterium]
MIWMIRINLLPTREGRRKVSGRRTLAIIGLVLVVEVLGLFLWYQAVEDDAASQMNLAQKTEQEVQRLEQAKKELEQREEAKLQLARQNLVFEKLKHEKTGPPEMLKFLSYVLTKKEDNLYNREELQAQEAAGWASGWDTDNLWITELDQVHNWLTIKGHARSHEDVAEFYRRLESGIYFVFIDPVVQKVITDPDFPDVELVEFEAEAFINYDPGGELKLHSEEIPPEIKDVIAEASEAGGQAGEEGK